MGAKVDETRLVRRLKRRDERAFGFVVERYQGPIFGVCYRMLGNVAEAEDIAQETFVRCFIAVGSFRGDSTLGTWLHRIAINLCRNRLKYLRRRSYNATSCIDDVPEGVWHRGGGSNRTVGERAPGPDQALEARQTQAAVEAALATVEPTFREVLVLRDIQGMTYQQIMKVTGLASGTVKSRLHRGRAALRRAYEVLMADSGDAEEGG